MSEHSQEAPKMFKVSRSAVTALQAGINQSDAAASVLAAARMQLKTAEETFHLVIASHQNYLSSLIQDAGFQVRDFAAYGLWEENGEVFVRASQKE